MMLNYYSTTLQYICNCSHDPLQVEVKLVDYGILVTVEKLKLKTINDDSVWSLPYQVFFVVISNRIDLSSPHRL